MIIDSEHTSIEVPVYLVYILRRNMQIISYEIHLYTQLLKLFRNNADVIQTRVFDDNITLRHGSHTDKRPDLDHVR